MFEHKNRFPVFGHVLAASCRRAGVLRDLPQEAPRTCSNTRKLFLYPNFQNLSEHLEHVRTPGYYINMNESANKLMFENE